MLRSRRIVPSRGRLDKDAIGHTTKGHTANNPLSHSCDAVQESIKVRNCEGFRMPAGCDVAGSAEGRRPKASKEGTRGGRMLPSGVYGDLMGAHGGRRHWGRVRWRRWIAWSAERSRERWRGVRSRAPRAVDVGASGGLGRRIGWMRVRSACRWRRWPPAGLRCGEALLGVMPPRS